jgi:cephalosporin hydroxylase
VWRLVVECRAIRWEFLLPAAETTPPTLGQSGTAHDLDLPGTTTQTRMNSDDSPFIKTRAAFMSQRAKSQWLLLFVTVLSIAAMAFLQWGKTNYASNWTYANDSNRPRLNDPQEKTRMQQAFEEIVARRDVKLPLEKQKEIARIFHELDIWKNMWFLGIPIQKNPCDLWMMQQIIYETRPEVIVETGTFRGGSALFFAHTLEGTGLSDAKVLTVDIEDACGDAATLPLWQKHVRFIHGSSTDPKVVAQIHETCRGKRVMVVLDSMHEKFHVSEELKLYSPLVGAGCYLIVEDTNSDGVPIFPGSVGPTAAVVEFLNTPEGRLYRQDTAREAMVLTFNPGGWLLKVE